MRAEKRPDESHRLEVLRSYSILNTGREQAFDEIVELAASLCEAPVAVVNLIDEDRQFYKAEVGTGGMLPPLEYAFCSHAILSGGYLEVPDTHQDARFLDNPLTRMTPGVRFYAGAVLETEDGTPLGTLCVLDIKPRELSDIQKRALLVLSRQVMTQLELRRRLKELERETAERVAAEKLALEHERFLRLITDRLPVLISYVDRDHRYKFLNGEYSRQFGVEAEDYIDRPIADLLGEKAAAAAKEHLQLAFNGNSHVAEQRMDYPFGSRYVEAIHIPDLQPSGDISGAVVHILDVTHRHEAELALHNEREKLKNVVSMAPALIMLLRGPEFIFEVANEAAIEFLGRDDILGKRAIEVTPSLANLGFLGVLEEVYATKGQVSMREAFYQVEMDGQPPRSGYLDQVYQALLGADGEVYGIAVHGIDVTARVQARRNVERANEELEAKIEARTRDLQEAVKEAEGFNYSISHDLRAPLRAINSTASILLMEAADLLSPEHRQLLQRQVYNAKKLGILVDDLLQLSRLARVNIIAERFDFSELCEEVISELSRDISRLKRIEIQPEMEGFGDPKHVRLLIANLLENSLKFTSEAGSIQVGLYASHPNPTYFVRDDGIGLDMTYAEKIFLPFERLVKEEQVPGTGIGLANVKRIVERHGGRIWVESHPGQGATFFFTLQAEDEALDPLEP